MQLFIYISKAKQNSAEGQVLLVQSEYLRGKHLLKYLTKLSTDSKFHFSNRSFTAKNHDKLSVGQY